MNDLTFIKDVIYGLKREYGSTIIVGSRAFNPNLQTGEKNITETVHTVYRAIPLPENWRKLFAQKLSNLAQGFIAFGGQQFLIDKSDLPIGFRVSETGFIRKDNKTADITQVEDYQYGYVISVKEFV